MPQIDIGAGTYPAWADQDFADEYLAADISRAPAWALLTNDTKGRALVSAARLIARLNWISGDAPDYDSAPDAIAQANSILAADLAADPSLSGTLGQESNIKRVKAGSAEVEFRPGGAGQSTLPLPYEAWALIAATGLVSAPGGGGEPFYSGGDFPSRFRPDIGFPDPETDWRL